MIAVKREPRVHMSYLEVLIGILFMGGKDFLGEEVFLRGMEVG